MLTHVDHKNQPTMVSVGHKEATERTAVAQSIVELPDEVMQHLKDGEIASKKGPVFATAIVAGTMAVKRCHELIPFCHPLPIEGCKITIEADGYQIIVRCQVEVFHKTGVEMEALTGASVAALTIYDMCKAMSHDIVIAKTELISKTGGKRDVQKKG
ncbi:cyclic pyranopterin monophosphate synthase MoaC [Pseudobacteriovorax antillogorgiicola]|uniref:cyclic pyranopterin monophosphate synthase n=1 Tax=Pseudobacteriovorax antillogorgiicola TaxID=1513793 RepID=A0A1Y6CAA6_9BACT|nr:cyclic pyranopterin monophosphate synthase MoaC [Pseudobacteriovorax antillogorgiicola]TCS49014.1 cyclic pyranopterin monophosphate synthase subunit MoaC [Pseudobacteriovorax antillogorgiicola]SMF53034.1 cyclic pyranopterin monophosphate synthase subunit MoaC [Pseudobacteriovorax antillogorgiicola]